MSNIVAAAQPPPRLTRKKKQNRTPQPLRAAAALPSRMLTKTRHRARLAALPAARCRLPKTTRARMTATRLLAAPLLHGRLTDADLHAKLGGS